MTKQGMRPLQASRHGLRPFGMLLIASLVCAQTDTQALQVAPSADPPPRPPPAQVEFEASFLSNGGQAIDVSRYSRGNVVMPGQYTTDIYVNGSRLGRRELRLAAAPGKTDAQPCLTRALLEAGGIDLPGLSAPATEQLPSEGSSEGRCLALAEIVPQATAHFDLDTLRLDLGVPQASMRRRARGYVGPDQWSAGVPMALLGYNLNAYHARNNGGRNATQGYLGLSGGFNLDRWHLRHNGSLSWNDQGSRDYQNISTFVQRDLADWSSQLLIGDSYTGGDLLDGTSFRSIRLHSDDRMLPESQRGYAPVVRGVANTNARVTISQGGMKLYETTVAPGPFAISDLYPTGYGGDLQVSIAEADGSVRNFAVPYASVPLSLREGRHRYSLTGGVVRHLRNSSPFMAQGTWQYGFGNALTGYVGTSVARGYFAPMVGAVLNTDWGAFGADLTHASTRVPGERSYSGQSLRASYAKSLPETGTYVAIAAYRYSTSGFFGLNEAMQARDLAKLNQPSLNIGRPRNRASLSMSQQLGSGGGHLNAVASTTRYWNGQNASNDFMVGYSNSFRSLAYNLSLSRQRDARGLSSTLLYAGLSIPLGGQRPGMLTSNLSRDSRGRSQAQSNLSGMIGDSNDLSYALGANYARGRLDGRGSDAQSNASGNLGYRGRYAEVSGSVSAGSGYQQVSGGLRGAIVAHPGGVTLSQPVGETFAIVEAKDAEGARVTNAAGVKIDARGYAVVPYVTPYVMNEISLDPKGLSTDVELQETSQHVAPVAGAVPLLVFKTAYSRSAVINARQQDGSPVPFGAVVSDRSGQDLALVGQAGKLLVRGLSDQGELQVQWATGTGPMGCSLSYALPQRQRAAGYQPPHSLQLPCVASGPVPPAQLARAVTANPQPLQRERDLAGLRLSTQLSVLVPAAAAASPGGRKAPMAQEQASTLTHEQPRDLKMERTLAALPQDTQISAWTPARI